MDMNKEDLLLTPKEIDRVFWKLAEEQARRQQAYDQSGENPLAKPRKFSELDRCNALLQAHLDKAIPLIAKEIFEEIEKYRVRVNSSGGQLGYDYFFYDDDLQKLKQGFGVK